MTFVAHNPRSQAHDLVGHPETAARAAAILAHFDQDPVLSRLPRLTPDRALTREEAMAVHTERLWMNLQSRRGEGAVQIDPDTYVGASSFDAATTTARLGLLAAERTLRTSERGFVVSRPPGHHATRDRSMGFCLLNNVALAADHALHHGAKRVLVFDHDVHHGNGTQDIFYETDQVLYESFHLWPHYPGTGAAEEVGTGRGSGFSVNAPLPVGAGDAEVRGLLLDVFLPIAKKFQPNLILVSSGFDSLEGDPLGGLRLSVPFFGEIVERLISVCPKVLCFLEGGYQLDRIPPAAAEELNVLGGRRVRLGSDVAATPSAASLKRLLADSWPTLR